MFKSLKLSALPWKHAKTKRKVTVNKMMADNESAQEVVILPEDTLVPCNTCSRTFLPASIKKHRPICERAATKKRKRFDSLRQRVGGTDLEHFHMKSYLKVGAGELQHELSHHAKQPQPQPRPISVQTPNRTKKTNLSTTSIQNRKTPTTTVAAVAASNERCPHCDRQFGVKAFDRHVEWCRSHVSLIQKSQLADHVQLAKERLEVRTKYKPPPLSKSKRSIVREKYSPGIVTPMMSRTPTSISSLKSEHQEQKQKKQQQRVTPNVQKPKSVMNLRMKRSLLFDDDDDDRLEEKSPITTTAISSDNLRKVPGKTRKGINSQNNSSIESLYDPFKMAERQMQQLLDCSDFVPSNSTLVRSHTTTLSSTTTPITTANPLMQINKEKSIKSADSIKSINQMIKPNNLPIIDRLSSVDAVDDNFETIEDLLNKAIIISSDDDDDINIMYNSNMIDPRLINENDNLSIPDNFLQNNSNYIKTILSSYDHDDSNELDSYSVQCDNKIEPQTLVLPLSSPPQHQITTKPLQQILNKSNMNENEISNIGEQSSCYYSSGMTTSTTDENDGATKDQGEKLLTKAKTPQAKANEYYRDQENGWLAMLDQNNKSTSTPNNNRELTTTSDGDGGSSNDEIMPKKSSTLDSRKIDSNIFSIGDDMYEEYKMYEEMYLKEKKAAAITSLSSSNNNNNNENNTINNNTKKVQKQRQKMNNNMDYLGVPSTLIAPTTDQSNQLLLTKTIKNTDNVNNDSAYSSLIRKTPITTKTTTPSKNKKSPSNNLVSSAAVTSTKKKTKKRHIFPVDSVDSLSNNSSSNSSSGSGSGSDVNCRMSKFCHQCGNKFPLTTAKFCVECGIRRLVL